MFDADEIILQAYTVTKTLESVLKTLYINPKILLLMQLLWANPRFLN